MMVLGIDGATWDVADDLIARGDLPNIGALVEAGASWVLRSTTPPVSPCAWTTMMTGVNPGRHGITGWGHLHLRRPFSSADVAAPWIWEWLGAAGLRVGAFNIPVTYPATPLSGFMVSGEIGTVHYDRRMFYPPELFDAAAGHAPDYPLPAGEAKCQIVAVERLQLNADTRQELATWLVAQRPVDVLLANVNYVDYAQHGFFAAAQEGADNLVHWAYRRADEFVGALRALAADDAHVLIVSDHGAGPIEGRVNLPALLRQLGLLAPAGRSQRGRVLWALRSLALTLERRIGLLRRSRLVRRARRSLTGQAYDWARTVAYPVPAACGVALNLPGRSPHPAVRPEERREVALRVARAIEAVRNPVTGGRDLRATLAEDVYYGPHVAFAPEVLLAPREYTWGMLSADPGSDHIFLTLQEAAALRPGNPTWEGGHRMEGVLAIAGPGVAPMAERARAEIADVTPTILSLLGLEAPDGAFDGAAVAHAASGETRAVALDAWAPAGAGATYSGEDAEQVERRLRDLGYY